MNHKVFSVILAAFCLALGGCQTQKVQKIDRQPVTFINWKECFRFMTVDVNMMLPNDDDALFKTAAESSMDWFWLEEGTTNIVIVIKLDFLDGPYSAIRGAHGNGPYYLFMPIEKGFQLPGKMAGNGYHHGTLNGRAQFITSWHMGGGEAYENIYDWDGKTFKLTSRILYRYDFDGSRKIIKVSSTDPPIPRPARRVAAPHN